MGTIDFRAAADENSIVDLSSQVHQLPCCIRFDGPVEVSHYFKPKSSGNKQHLYVYVFLVFTYVLYSIVRLMWKAVEFVDVEIDGVKTEEAHFRGRKLQGATISLPSGYSGTFFFLLRKSCKLLISYGCLSKYDWMNVTHSC